MSHRTILLLAACCSLSSSSCVTGEDGPSSPDSFYRDAMREFVQDISQWARSASPGFIVVPQNGQELFTTFGALPGPLETEYLSVLDGTGREDLFFGYTADDQATPASETTWMAQFLDIAEANGVHVLVTDYCWTQWKVDSSYSWSQGAGYISFAADHRELDDIPGYPAEPYGLNGDDILTLGEACNFLYLIDPEVFPDRRTFVTQVSDTGYDVLILDLFYGDEQLSADDLATLGVKPGGGSRLVLAYVSIGEAEDYRYYWQDSWTSAPPYWLYYENPDWPGNYLVDYSDPEWQSIIFGSDGSYVGRVIASGFDGVYLDKIDSFEELEATDSDS